MRTASESLNEVCRPGLVICHLFPQARKETGVTLSAVRFAAESEYYSAVEFAEVNDYSERKQIAEIASAADLKVVYWLALMQYGMDASISALDEDERRRAVGQLISQIPFAAECRASYVGFLSGPDVPPARRAEAKRQLFKSICELAEAAVEYGNLEFLLESMDREAHKKNLIGPTPEAVDFIMKVRKIIPGFQLCFDTSHIKLLGEEPTESLEQARGVVSQIHLANCVSDPARPKFGDNHMPLGEPGFLTEQYISKMFQKALDIGLLGESRPIVSAECASPGGDEAWELERITRQTVLRAWELLDRIER